MTATTSAQIETLLETNVFANASLKSTYTTKLIKYELSEDSEVELNAISYNQAINFFQLLVRRQEKIEGLNRRRLEFIIKIRYVVEKTAQNLSYTKIRNGLETVQDLIAATLGATESAYVDFYELQNLPDFTLVRIANQPCWQGEFNMTAIKSVSLE